MTTQQRDPQVERYLLSLAYSIHRLPRRRRQALRQQIVEHLDEVVAAADTESEVRAALDRLGPPSVLVDAELAEIGGRWAVTKERLRDWGWNRWAVVAVVLAVLGSVGGYTLNMYHQPQLQGGCQPCGWLFPWDRAHAKQTDNFAGEQWIVPYHYGHRQGFGITAYNPSSWPTTVLGLDRDGTPLLQGAQIQLELAPFVNSGRGELIPPPHATYRESLTIPPHGYVAIRVLWRATACRHDLAGGSEGFDTLPIRAKVGWFTHTEQLDLGQAWGIKTLSCTGNH